MNHCIPVDVFQGTQHLYFATSEHPKNTHVLLGSGDRIAVAARVNFLSLHSCIRVRKVDAMSYFQNLPLDNIFCNVEAEKRIKRLTNYKHPRKVVRKKIVPSQCCRLNRLKCSERSLDDRTHAPTRTTHTLLYVCKYIYRGFTYCDFVEPCEDYLVMYIFPSRVDFHERLRSLLCLRLV